MLQLVSRHVIEIQEIGLSYEAPENGWPSSDSRWQHCYMLGTTTKLSMMFQPLKGVFLGLGLIVTEINIKKVQKQDL